MWKKQNETGPGQLCGHIASFRALLDKIIFLFDQVLKEPKLSESSLKPEGPALALEHLGAQLGFWWVSWVWICFEQITPNPRFRQYALAPNPNSASRLPGYRGHGLAGWLPRAQWLVRLCKRPNLNLTPTLDFLSWLPNQTRSSLQRSSMAGLGKMSRRDESIKLSTWTFQREGPSSRHVEEDAKRHAAVNRYLLGHPNITSTNCRTLPTTGPTKPVTKQRIKLALFSTVLVM